MKKLYITVLLICTGILIVSGYKLMSFYKEDQKYIEEFSKLSEIAEKNITQKSKEYKTEELPFYSDLYNQNKDFAGWISIKDTTINYPVMYSPKNPDYYLKHNFEKQYSDYGVPYISEACSIAPLSDNTIIYGHNITGGRMFGALLDYTDKEFYENHKFIEFNTRYKKGKYEIIAVFKTSVYDDKGFKYYTFINADSKDDYMNFINQCKKLSFYETEATAEFGDKLITISTCDNGLNNRRFVIVAKELT